MPSSLDHTTQFLKMLRVNTRRNKDTTDAQQQEQLTAWAAELCKYDANDVTRAITVWKDTQEWWPSSWKQLKEAVEAARDGRRAQNATERPPAELTLSDAANIAFGFLGNPHLREFDRRHNRAALVRALAEWTLPQARLFAQATGTDARTAAMQAVTAEAERLLGKTAGQICREETEARGEPLAPVPGFNRIPDEVRL
jgi:hypothetical protein